MFLFDFTTSTLVHPFYLQPNFTSELCFRIRYSLDTVL